jgi:DNA-binding NtrC family response regulator
VKPVNILIVEDDETSLHCYNDYFTHGEFQLTSAKTLSEAKTAVTKSSFDIMLLDMRLPDGDSTEWIPEFNTSNPGTPVIIITGLSDISFAVNAIKNGAENYLLKPIDMSALKVIIEKCLAKELLRKRNIVHDRIANRNKSHYGNSVQTKEMLEYAHIASKSPNVILLLGETGTGKGLLARWIHDNSKQANKPFIEINCSSLKGDLLRSELFGHTRGAFTSAIKDKEGLLEVADGGTLFLDEIGEMDLDVQALLLKTIEEKSFRRLGENAVRKSDFRLLCATNKDLLDDKAIRFRRDLYYRICVFPIEITPLRQKVDEIPWLCEQMLIDMGYTQIPLDNDIYKALSGYAWPGNIRELKNMIERALMLAQGKKLLISHFPGLVNKGLHEIITAKSNKLVDIESAHIDHVIDMCSGNMLQASELLGLCVSSLYRRLGKKNK